MGQAYVGRIYRCRAKSPAFIDLFQMQHDSPHACFNCPPSKIFFGSVVGICIRRGKTRQGIAYLDSNFIAEIYGFLSRVLPVVLDLDQPCNTAGKTKNVDGFRPSGDALKMLLIKRPIVVFACLAAVRKGKRQRSLSDFRHEPRFSRKRSDCASSSSSASSGSTSSTMSPWETSTPSPP